ncbi:MAG TPA: ribonuclease P protein component [Acidobacteriota bacterium]|nr:ribonuclease P protein component [Acidobacteriota bacterium]
MRPKGFPRTHHLRKRSDFERVYAEGTKQVGSKFVLFTLANGRRHPRLGITATRRLGGAVVRNRARRLVREAFRSQWEGFAAGYDYVVVARPGTVTSSPGDLLPELLALAARATEPPA